MTREALMRAANRYEVLVKVEQKIFKMAEAAAVLGLCKRQLRRLKRKVEAEGIKGLLNKRVHPAPNKVVDREKAEILRLRRETYRKYNLSHFVDMLANRHGIEHSREYYRKLFLENKLYVVQQKKRRKDRHRKRFEAPQAGVLIQRDTSIHFWVPWCKKAWKLILDLDDHSRKITGALFSERDDVVSNMHVAWETISTHGIPFAYYTDNNPIYNPLNKKPRHGAYQFYRWRDGEEKETLSQFKRALHELGIECIHATPYQPQGKGKIERIFRFMQDRLAHEMETAGVKTIHEANKYLKKWVEWYNHCHVHSVTKQIPNERYMMKDSFREVPKSTKLEEIFCLKYERVVKADNTIQLDGRTYQIRKNEYRISYARAKIEVRVYLSKKIRFFYKNREIYCGDYKTNKNKQLRLGEDILALQ